MYLMNLIKTIMYALFSCGFKESLSSISPALKTIAIAANETFENTIISVYFLLNLNHQW